MHFSAFWEKLIKSNTVLQNYSITDQSSSKYFKVFKVDCSVKSRVNFAWKLRFEGWSRVFSTTGLVLSITQARGCLGGCGVGVLVEGTGDSGAPVHFSPSSKYQNTPGNRIDHHSPPVADRSCVKYDSYLLLSKHVSNLQTKLNRANTEINGNATYGGLQKTII